MDNLMTPGLTLCLIDATLAAGTTTTLSTTGTTHYAVKGKAYTKAALSNTANVTTDVNTGAAFVAQAINTMCVYVVGYDADGNIKVAQGTIVSLDAQGNPLNAPQFPPIPDTVCPIGYVVIANDSTGSAWTWGSSNWTATGITDTFVSVITLPPRPTVS